MADTRQEIADPKAYIRKLHNEVGTRNPLDVLAETPAILQKLARSAPADVFHRRPFEGKWTPAEVLGHLLDAEFVFAYRVRTIFCDDSPQIIGMDQDKWAAALQHNQRDPQEIVRDFTAIRTINLGVYRAIPKSAWSRFGQHSERGKETLSEIFPYAAGHDLWHIKQIEKYLAAARGMK